MGNLKLERSNCAEVRSSQRVRLVRDRLRKADLALARGASKLEAAAAELSALVAAETEKGSGFCGVTTPIME